jgi:hypothetical protein
LDDQINPLAHVTAQAQYIPDLLSIIAEAMEVTDDDDDQLSIAEIPQDDEGSLAEPGENYDTYVGGSVKSKQEQAGAIFGQPESALVRLSQRAELLTPRAEFEETAAYRGCKPSFQS